MFQFVRGIALVAAMLLGCGASFAEENVRAAKYVMTGCRAIGEPMNSVVDALLRGRCAGIVETLAISSGVCQPQGVTTRQAVLVVVRYIDGKPERMHEDFTLLAHEALLATWPCKK